VAFSNPMGRKPTRVSGLQTGYQRTAWAAPYVIEWGVVVGDRARRLRNDRGWRLFDLANAVSKPEGGHYSAGYFSRLERGWTMAPLYVYVAVAEALGVAPGRLLGPDAVQLEASADEMVLLRLMRRQKMDPAEAIARLIAPASHR
jgi:transcriptional regulator with XRE-family HTH domain